MSESGRNKIFTIEHREHLRQKSIGNKAWLGKKHSEETKKKMSLAKLKRKLYAEEQWEHSQEQETKQK